MGFLIDTCIWVDVERGKITPADVAVYTKKEPVYLSPITIAELTYGVEITGDENLKNKRISALNRLKKKPFLIIDEITAEIFGKITADLFRKGKQSKYRVQDIWLAAQSIQYNFNFLTSNIKDFNDIPGLQLIEFGK